MFTLEHSHPSTKETKSTNKQTLPETGQLYCRFDFIQQIKMELAEVALAI